MISTFEKQFKESGIVIDNKTAVVVKMFQKFLLDMVSQYILRCNFGAFTTIVYQIKMLEIYTTRYYAFFY